MDALAFRKVSILFAVNRPELDNPCGEALAHRLPPHAPTGIERDAGQHA